MYIECICSLLLGALAHVGDVCEVKMGRSKYAGKIMAIGEYDCKSSAV